MCALQRASLHALANQISAGVEGEHVKAVRQAFVAMDSDNSGTVNRTEFVEVLAGVPELAGVDAADLFDALDACTGGQGALEWRWFLAATLAAPPPKSKTAKVGTAAGTRAPARSPTAPLQPGLMDAFIAIDRDGDGLINVGDMASALHDAGSALNEAAVKELLVQAGHGPPSWSLTVDDFVCSSSMGLATRSRPKSPSRSTGRRARRRGGGVPLGRWPRWLRLREPERRRQPPMARAVIAAAGSQTRSAQTSRQKVQVRSSEYTTAVPALIVARGPSIFVSVSDNFQILYIFKLETVSRLYRLRRT